MLRSLIVFAALLAAPMFAHAVVLNPGDTAVAVPTETSTTAPQLAGVVVNVDSSIPITIEVGGTVFGTVSIRNRVTLSDTLGTLIFSPQVDSIARTGAGAIELASLTVEGFAGFTTDVFTKTDAVGAVVADTADRSGDGNAVSFNFVGYDLSTLTFPLEIVTNATQFAATGTVILEGTVTPTGAAALPFTARASGFDVPINPVPLPATAVLLFGGIAALAAVRRRA